MRPLVPLSQASLSRGYAEHKIILDALISRDPKKTEKAMQKHNRGMQVQIRKVMDKDSVNNPEIQ